MKVVAISDTHDFHNQVEIPKCDILIHAGDFSRMGRSKEIKSFMRWFSQQPAKYLVYIAGNHDLSYETHKLFMLDYGDRGKVPLNINETVKDEMLGQYPNIIYLENNGVEIEGLNLWGSPYSPEFHNWAFGYERESREAEKIWGMVPSDTDILITHGPPKNILDRCAYDSPPYPQNAGCLILLDKIKEVKPRWCVFGHIHECFGTAVVDETIFMNVSICNLKYQPVNKPTVFYANKKEK